MAGSAADSPESLEMIKRLKHWCVGFHPEVIEDGLTDTAHKAYPLNFKYDTPWADDHLERLQVELERNLGHAANTCLPGASLCPHKPYAAVLFAWLRLLWFL